MENKGEIVIYHSKDGNTELGVRLEQNNLWLSQIQIARLFKTDRSVITKHLNNIFKSKEVDDKSNVQKMHIANSDKLVHFYSIDCVLSVGYRVNSIKATHFRQWATNILKEHIIRGFTINERRLVDLESQSKEQGNTMFVMNRTINHILLNYAKRKDVHSLIDELEELKKKLGNN